MSACIYHDAEAVTICPSCDFGVCQACMDGGGDGVCATCFEERSSRQETVATSAEVRRCNYCRAAEDDLTTIDEEGYCEACRVLPRCNEHSELIAVGQCKGCRQEFCRKCLGFSDYCPTCTAKGAAKPAAPPPSARPAGDRPRKKRPPGAQGKRPPGKKGAEPPAKGRPTKGGKGKAEEPGKQPSRAARGRMAIESRMRAKQGDDGRVKAIAAVSVLAIALLISVVAAVLNLGSPAAQAENLRDQMTVVQHAVLHYQQVVGHLPDSPQDIYRSLADLKVPGYKHIRVAMKTDDAQKPPMTIFYDHTQRTFTVMASDASGQLLKAPSGTPIYLDQNDAENNQ